MALLSAIVKLSLGLWEPLRILTVYCQISSAVSSGRAPTAFTPLRISLTETNAEVTAQFRPVHQCARALCDQDSLHAKLVFPKDVFRKNGYNERHIHGVRQPNISQPKDNPDSVAFLPYVRPIFNQISRVLSRHIMSVGLNPKEVSTFLRPVNDNLGLRTLGVCRIPRECSKVNIEQTPFCGHQVKVAPATYLFRTSR
jgi:hypothetical protein